MKLGPLFFCQPTLKKVFAVEKKKIVTKSKEEIIKEIEQKFKDAK